MLFYDKDGYELTKIEKAYYKAQGYKLQKCLNKEFLTSPWMTLNHDKLYLEHCMILNRCDFSGYAREQLLAYRPKHRLLNYLLLCRPKWGVDIALDWIDDNGIVEILHLEYDRYNVNEAIEIKSNLENFMLKNDLEDMAKNIIKSRDSWCHLTGYNQNLWKARYLGFKLSEDTQKSI